MKLLLKMILFFLKSAALGLIIGLTSSIIEIMLIGVINALFGTGISHNNYFIICSFWIVFISTTLLLFFKFTSLKEKESELDFFNKYSSKKKSNYTIVELFFLGKKKSGNLTNINFFYYEKKNFQKAVLIPMNKIKSTNYDLFLKDKTLVFKDYETYVIFNKIYQCQDIVILTAEHYKKTYKHSIPLSQMLEEKKILMRKDKKIYQYIEDNYNKFFVRSYYKSEIDQLNLYYQSCLKRGEN